MCSLLSFVIVMVALLNTSILSWNIRGVQNSNSKRHLKELIRKFNPTYLAILETHTPYARLSFFWNNLGYTPVHIIEAIGHSGGIWLLKQTASTTSSTIIHHNQYSITFSIQRGNAFTTCTCVYASPNFTMHHNLWSYLTNISHNITSLWMLIGDFNETFIPSEQRGGIFNQNRAALFSNFMNSCNLLDLSTTGSRFTWHRNKNAICILSKKLDRSLANVDWRITFPKAFVEVLCRLHSDHNPLLLRFWWSPYSSGPQTFPF